MSFKLISLCFAVLHFVALLFLAKGQGLGNGFEGVANPQGDRRDSFDNFMDPISSPQPITGDMLNTTKCYCQPAGAEHFDPKKEAGHYYQWIYYNFHSETWFNISRWCRTTHRRQHKVPNKPNLHKINDCLTYWNEDQGTPSCDLDSMGNTFCTRLEWEDGDWISYNRQKRAHTGFHALAPALEARDRCHELCSLVGTPRDIAIGGKLDVIAGQYRAELNKHLDQHQDFMWSFIDSDYNVPDMCPNCK